MPAGTDLIFFDDSTEWTTIVSTSRTARRVGENSHEPIGSFDLGVTLNDDYIAVVAGTTEGKPSWFFAGDITQVYNFAPGGSNPILGKVQPQLTRLAINRLQVIETTRISPDPFRLRYTPPYWFRDCTIRVYKYTGDKLNFVEDSLFSIGNALKVHPNTGQGLIDGQLTVIEELITDKFQELQISREAEEQLDDLREASVQQQLNQLDAGVYTIAEGLASLLPSEQGNDLRQRTRNRLNLDLGFL